MLFPRWLNTLAGRILGNRTGTHSAFRHGSGRGTSLAVRPASWIVTPNGVVGSAEFGDMVERLEERTLLDASHVLQSTLTAFHGEDHVGKDGPLASVGYNLTYLYHEFQDYLGSGTGSFEPSSSLVNVIGDGVVVDVTADGDVGTLSDSLEAIGMQVSATFGQVVSGLMPINSIPAASGLGGLGSVSAAAAISSVGSTTSQGDAAQFSNDARTNFGVNGSGVTVGVLSDSYNALSGATADVLSNDLPGVGNTNGFTTPVNVLSDFGSGSDEGRAMLQLVHDVAPGAELAFHTAFNGQADFAQGILDLAAAGADVIVDDVFYIAEPMFQDGIIAQAVDTVVAGGIPYFSSAGNHARQSYESAFVSSGISGGTNVFTDLHDFGGGDAFQQITIPAFSAVTFIFQWDEPFGNSASDVDIYLLDAASTSATILAFGFDFNVGGDPIEIFSYTNSTASPLTAHLAIDLFFGTAPGLMKYIYLGSATINEYDTLSSTSWGHANAAGAIAVGAAFYGATPDFGTSPPLLEGFSSAGGTPILFDAAGNPIAPVIRTTPDITAPDGGNTTFFGGDIGSDLDSFPNFFGTSAAAPHAAGAAALMLDVLPGLTPNQVLSTLQITAIDMGVLGFDLDSGSGLIDVNAALVALTTIDAPAGGGTITVEISGGNFVVTQGATTLYSVPAAGIPSSLTINGTGGADDTLIVDFSGGDPIPSGGLTFNGGVGGNDTLEITGNTSPFGTATLDFDNPNDGTIQLDSSTITYTGLDPIDMTGSDVNNLVLNFTSAMGETITLSDDGTVNDGNSEITSTQGELLVFATPNVSLTITTNFGTGAGVDTVNIEGVDGMFDADLTVTTGNDDSVAFQTSTTDIGSGDFLVTSGSVAINADVMTTGDTTMTANAASLVVAADLSIGGTLNLDSNGDNVIVNSGNTLTSNQATFEARNDINISSLVSGTTGISMAAGTDGSGESQLLAGGSLTSSAGGLTITAAGPISDGPGTISVFGTTSLTAGAGNNITLDSANNFGGDVTVVSGNDVTLNDTGAISFGGTSTISGNLIVTAAGLISDGALGTLAITGTTSLTGGAANNITLDNSNAFGGAVTVVSGNDVTLNDVDGVTLAGATTTGLLSATAATASIVVSGNLSVGGQLTLDSNGDNVIVNSGNTLTSNQATFEAKNDINISSSVSGTTGISMTAGTDGSGDFLLVTAGGSLSSSAGSLTISADGSVSDGPGAVSIFGTTTVTATGFDITLDTPTNDFTGAVSADGANVLIDDDNAVSFGAVTATADFTVDAGGNVSFDGLVNVTGNLDAQSDANGTNGAIDVNAKMTVGGTVLLDADDGITIDAAIDPTTVTMTSDDDITVSASVDATASITVTAGQDGSGSINGAGLMTAPTVDLNAATGIGDTTPLELAATSISADTTTGNIDLDNALATAVSATSLTTGAGSVTFDQSGGGDLTTSTVSATTSASLTNTAGAITLDGSLMSDSLLVSATGMVTDGAVGDLAITNNANFSGSTVTLGNNVGNNTAFGSLTFSSAGAVDITEDDSTTVSGASTASGLTLVSADDVTLNATVNVTGNTTITAGTATGGIDVNAKLTGSGTILLDAADEITIDAAIDPTTVTLEADDDITVSASVDATVSITVTAGQDGSGSINGAGSMTAPMIDLNAATGIGNTTALELAATSISADTTNGDIDLDNANAAAATFTSLTTGTGGITVDNDGTGGGSASFTTVSTTDGAIDLESIAGDLTVGTSVTAGGSNNVSLTTTTSGNVVLTGTTTAMGDTVAVMSAGGVTDSDVAVDITAATLTVVAGSFGASGADIDTSVDSLNIDTSASNGDQFIHETTGLTDLNLNAGTGDITLVDEGQISDTAADGTDIAADSFSLTITTSGEFGAGGNRIETDVTSLSATTLGQDRNVYIAEANSLTNTNITIFPADIHLSAGGDINTGTGILTGNAANLVSGGNINVDTTVSQLNFSTTANGNITVDETNTLTQLNISAGTGDVTITAGGAITDGDGATDITADAVSLTATASGSIALQLVAASIGATTPSGNIDLDNTPTTNVSITGLTITAPNPGDFVHYTQTGFDLSIDGPITSGDGGITLDPPVNVTINATLNGGAGPVLVEADNDITFDDGGSITNATTVTLTADFDGDLAGSIVDAQTTDITDITATGLVTLSAADGIGSALNTLETDAPSLVATTTDNGDIVITEANGLTDLDLSAGTGDVTLTLTLGGITDTAADGTDITATNATITLSDTAAQDVGAVGAAGNIETSVSSLSASTSAGNGSIFVTESSGLTDLNLDAGTGDVTLTISGSVTDSSADGTDIAADMLTVTITGGDFGTGTVPGHIDTAISSLNVSTSGTNQNYYINELDDLIGGVTANTLGDLHFVIGGNFDTFGGLITSNLFNITAGGYLIADTTISQLVASTAVASGNIGINETNALGPIDVSAGTGDVTITAGGVITDADGAADIAADEVDLTAAAIGASGSPLSLSAAALATDTSASNGDQYLSEFDSLTWNTSTAGAGDIDLDGGRFNVGSGQTITAMTLSVNSGATLGGSGTVSATVSVAGGGTVSPGASTAILNTNDVSFSAGSDFDVEINGTIVGTDYDQLNVTGTASLGAGNATLNLSGTYTPVSGDSFTIIQASVAVTGTFNGIADLDDVFFNLQPLEVDYQFTAVVLSYDSTPVINAGAGDNLIEVRRDAGGNIEVVIDSIVVMDTPQASLTSLTINGQGGDDTLTVDYGFAGGFFNTPITFDGGSNTPTGDELFVSGGGFTSVEYDVTGVGAGTLTFTGPSTTIDFTGVEPATITSLLGTVTIDIDNGGVDAFAGTITTTVLDAAGSNMTVDFDVAAEDLTFTTPSVALIILGDNTDDDVVTVTSVDTGAPYRAALTIDGQGATDSIDVNTSLTLGSGTSSGNLTLTAETINLNAASINTGAAPTAGSVSLTGTTINIDQDLTIDTNSTTDGTLSVSGAVDAVSGTAQTLTLDVGTTSVSLTNVANDFSSAVSGVVVTSAVNVTLVDANAIDLGGPSTIAGFLSVTSSGAITDSGNLSVIGNASFSAGAGAITLGDAGETTNFGSLTFNTTVAVSISEDSPMDIAGVNTAGSADLDSTAGISDAGATSVTVTGFADVSGMSISLGGGTFDAGALTFNSVGAVAISEDSSMDIVGVNTAGSTDLDSTAGITDAGATSIAVTGLVDVAGTSISLGGGTFDAGTLRFNSVGAVVISEDSSMDIVGVNTAGSADLDSTAGISDAGATSVTVSGLMDVNGTSILLGGGTFNAGMLTFASAAAVVIGEDSAMDLAGASSAGTLTLVASGAITDSGTVTAGTTSLTAGAVNDITLDNANNFTGAVTVVSGDDVTLNDTDALTIAAITATSAINLTAGGDDNLLTISGAVVGGLSSTFTADKMAIGASVNVGASTLTLVSTNAGDAIDLGSAVDTAVNTLELSDPELDFVTAGTIAIGNASSGMITISAAMSQGAKNLTLTNGGAGLIDFTGGSLATTGNVTLTTGSVDSGTTATDVTASTLSITASSADIGASGNPLTMSVTTLDTDSSTGGGDQFLSELDSLTWNSSTAGTGTIDLDSGRFNVGSGQTITAMTLNVNSGATLGGSGTVSATVSVAGGGTVSPGASTAILNTNDVSFAAGSDFDVEINGTIVGADYDQLNVTGTASLGAGNATLNLSGTYTPVIGDSFTIIQASVAVTGTFNGIADLDDVFFNLQPLEVDYQATAVVLSYDSTPVINAGAGDNVIEVRRDGGGNIEVVIDSVVVMDTPQGSLTSLTINGQGDDDAGAVTYGWAGGFFNTPITFDGGSNTAIGDELFVSGGSFTSVEYDVTGVGAGTLTFSGPSTTIDFTGVEPATITSLLGTVTIDIDNGVDAFAGTITTTVLDAAGSNMTVDFDVAAEDLTFTTPSVALIILGDNTGDDVITVASVDANAPYSAALSIDGQGANDSINVNASLTLGSGTSSGNLTLTAETINLNAASIATDGTSTAGSVSLIGTTVINIDANLTIDTNATVADGTLSVSGPIDAVFGTSRTLTLDIGTTSVSLTNAANDFSSTVAGVVVTSANNVTLVDANDIELGGPSTITGFLSVTSSGNITDSGNLSVFGNASFSAGAGAITLGDAGETTNFGSLTFNTTGAVSISEDTATSLTGTNTADNLVLTSAGTITDATGASVTVTTTSSMSGTSISLTDNGADVLSVGTNASFTASGGGAITVVATGVANFGSLTFNTTGVVSVTEDSDTDLNGTSTASSLTLTSSGAITDAASASVTVTTTSSMSGTSISLTDNALDVLSVGGTASFTASGGGAITVAAAGTANFGSLTFNTTGAVTMTEDTSTNLAGTSTAGTLTLTSAGAITDSSSLTVTTDATFSGTSITLADLAADVLSVGGNASFTATSGGITVAAAGTVNFGSLTFNATGAVSITEDSASDLTGSNTANSLALTSSGAITDQAGTSVIVTNGATINAGANSITLADNGGDTLSVGLNASFTGSAITVAAAGAVTFGSLTFNGTGAVSITEDNQTDVTGTNTANSLALTSSAAVVDATGTSLTVTNNASFSGTSITLGDQAGDTTNFGSLSFSSAGAVTVTEDSAMNVGGTATNTSDTLTLTSQAGGITVQDTGLATDISATGAITFTVQTNNLFFTTNASTLTTTSAGGVTVVADKMDLLGAITASGQTVSLRNSVGTDAINLGSTLNTSANTLELSDAELDLITAGTIAIGNSLAGTVTISAAITRPAATNLTITTGTTNAIVFTAGSLNASGGNVTLTTGSGGVISGSTSTDVTAAALSVTAGSTGIGASGNPLTMAVTSLTTNTNGVSNGNQFLSEADTLTITSLNAGTGTIELSSGTFVLGGPELINDNSDLTVNTPAIFDLGGFSETIDALAGTGTVTSGVAGPVSLSEGNNNGTSTFSGVIQNGGGTVSLTKNGTGILTLTGGNTYTGLTVVNAGTLLVNGSTAVGSAVTVNSPAILGGTGTIGGSVTLASGSTFSPGSPVTTTADLATSDLVFAAGAAFTAQVNGATPNTLHDQVIVTGSVVLGSATFNRSGTVTSVPGQQIVLIKNDGVDVVSGIFSGLVEGASVVINGVTFLLSYQGGAGGNDVTLTQAGPVIYSGAGALELRLNGTSVEFLDDLVVIDSRPLASVLNQTITVNGTSAVDTLTVNYAFGGFFDVNVV